MQPTLRLSEAIKKAQEAVKKRSNKLLDYDQARSKSKRNTPDLSKQQRAEAEEQAVRQAFDQIDEALRHDLPILYQATDGMLDESTRAAMILQGLLVNEVFDGLSFVPEPQESNMEIGRAIDKIKSLQIASP